MVRMWVDRSTFRPAVDPGVERLTPADAGELNRLYRLGFGSWLPPQAVAEGVYYGIRVNGRLVAAAGTHVIGRRAGIAVVGNVLTQPEYRGRGYAQATTAAVTAHAARVLRPCRAQRPLGQPAGAQRVPAAGVRRARSVRGTARASDRLAVGRHRLRPPTVRAEQGVPSDDDDGPNATRHRPRRHGSRARRRGRPADRVGRARDARPALHPRAVRDGAARSRALRIGACLHVTTETANLMRTLQAGGARGRRSRPRTRSRRRTTSRRPSSTEYGIPVHARRGEDRDTYYRHL